MSGGFLRSSSESSQTSPKVTVGDEPSSNKHKQSVLVPKQQQVSSFIHDVEHINLVPL